jgi:hypothetical protein
MTDLSFQAYGAVREIDLEGLAGNMDAWLVLERALNQLNDGFPVAHASLLHELSALPARRFRFSAISPSEVKR